MRPAATITQYLASLPVERRTALARVREVINANLPAGYVELFQHGMIGWCVPLARYPQTYNGQPLMVAALASQKRHMAVYLMGVYGDPALEAWFRGAYARSGKKLDMGKSCVRFAELDALPLDVIGETIRRLPVDAFLARYEAVKGAPTSKKSAKKPANKPAAKAARPTTKQATKAASAPKSRARAATPRAKVTAKRRAKA